MDAAHLLLWGSPRYQLRTISNAVVNNSSIATRFSQWLWLFSRAQVEEVESRPAFQEMVMESESFHIVLFMDGETCGPCRSAKTNALRLSAGLMGSGADARVSFVNCGRDTEVRKFCTDEVGIQGTGWAPQVRGYAAGSEEVKGEVGFAGELLYNANEVPPHAALRMIESIVRLSSKVDEAEGAMDGGGGGKKGGWDEGEKESEDDQSHPPGEGGGRPRRPEFKGPKLNWNGPSARQLLGGGGGGGGHHSRPMLGGG